MTEIEILMIKTQIIQNTQIKINLNKRLPNRMKKETQLVINPSKIRQRINLKSITKNSLNQNQNVINKYRPSNQTIIQIKIC